ncbi:MAG: hypothetical protein AB1898_30655 [Acidobacteriota bacterium]
MKTLSTILLLTLGGFLVVGLIHNDPLLVLKNFERARQELQVSCVVSIILGWVISVLRS